MAHFRLTLLAFIPARFLVDSHQKSADVLQTSDHSAWIQALADQAAALLRVQNILSLPQVA